MLLSYRIGAMRAGGERQCMGLQLGITYTPCMCVSLLGLPSSPWKQYVKPRFAALYSLPPSVTALLSPLIEMLSSSFPETELYSNVTKTLRFIFNPERGLLKSPHETNKTGSILNVCDKVESLIFFQSMKRIKR